MKKHNLPSNFKEGMVFTLLMSFFMASIMYLYNQAIHTGGLTWDTFKAYDYHFLIFWGIAYILALFVAHPLAEKMAFKVIEPSEKPFIINLVVSTFTVCLMVAMMSVVGVITNAIMTNTFNVDIILSYITSLFTGFIFALPLNILVVGPFVRWIFSLIYYRKYKRLEGLNIVTISSEQSDEQSQSDVNKKTL